MFNQLIKLKGFQTKFKDIFVIFNFENLFNLYILKLNGLGKLGCYCVIIVIMDVRRSVSYSRAVADINGSTESTEKTILSLSFFLSFLCSYSFLLLPYLNCSSFQPLCKKTKLTCFLPSFSLF